MQKVFYLLGELTDDDIDWLLAVSDRRELPIGAVLIEEGRSAQNLYLVLDGILEVVVAAANHRQIAILYTGDTVGEMSFVDARPPSATVRVVEPALVLTIPRAKLSEKLALDTGFASRFYRALAILLSNRLRETVRRVNDEVAQHDDLVENHENELINGDQAAIEAAALARVRFDWLLRRLRSGDIADHTS